MRFTEHIVVGTVKNICRAVGINLKEMPISHLFNQLWIFEVCDQARDKGNVCEMFARFPLNVKPRLFAVRTLQIILSRTNETAAGIDATIIYYRLERGQKLSAGPGNLKALKTELSKHVMQAFE